VVEPAGPAAPLVLHVVEAWGGGVTSAVYDYIRSAPQYRHALLVGSRDAHLTRDASAPAVECYLSLPPTRHMPHALAAIARAYRELRPAVVHAHSSVAGALVRLVPGVPTDAIVYTPHCFSFERRDLSALLRCSYRTIERLLFRRAAVIAACSPREAELAHDLGPRAHTRVRYVPNVFRAPRRDVLPAPARGSLRVVGQGRLNLQKDPAFFREVVAAVHAVDPTVEFTWIGGDPESEVEAMRAVGVDTTGWVPRQVVLERLGRAHVYLHTASWEGAPVALLEAAASGLAVVARDIPAMSSLDVPLRRSGAGELAELVLALRDPRRLAHAQRQTARWLDAHEPQEQVAALGGVYLDVTRQTLVPLLPVPGRSGAEPVGRR
jgi:glycosyltransferase involved in cell wall biosynthesis